MAPISTKHQESADPEKILKITSSAKNRKKRGKKIAEKAIRGM